MPTAFNVPVFSSNVYFVGDAYTYTKAHTCAHTWTNI